MTCPKVDRPAIQGYYWLTVRNRRELVFVAFYQHDPGSFAIQFYGCEGTTHSKEMADDTYWNGAVWHGPIEIAEPED